MRKRNVLSTLLLLCTIAPACDEASSVPEPEATPDTGADAAAAAALPFCPTAIDVFGYSNVLFSGCGGAGVPTNALPAGLFSPGTSGYDRTLAGRLQRRILADSDLTAKFGTTWRIRSCSQGGGVMDTFVSTAFDPQDTSGTTGKYLSMCTSSPGAMALYSANNVYDQWHGGGANTRPDDQATYASHWAARFQEFLDQRRYGAVLVSPQHEWHGEQGGSLANPDTCTWQRPTWNRAGLTRWRTDHPTVARVTEIGDLQDTFLRHHPCCATRGVTCEQDWFARSAPGQTGGGDGWVHFGCAGADALEAWWFDKLKTYLMARSFSCN